MEPDLRRAPSADEAVSEEQDGPMSGLLPVAKPASWTSHDVVAVARGVLGVRRVGHGGTLDPLATGLLPLLVGAATPAVLPPHTPPKGYPAPVRFGSRTATPDAAGPATPRAGLPDTR